SSQAAAWASRSSGAAFAFARASSIAASALLSAASSGLSTGGGGAFTIGGAITGVVIVTGVEPRESAKIPSPAKARRSPPPQTRSIGDPEDGAASGRGSGIRTELPCDGAVLAALIRLDESDASFCSSGVKVGRQAEQTTF